MLYLLVLVPQLGEKDETHGDRDSQLGSDKEGYEEGDGSYVR